MAWHHPKRLIPILIWSVFMIAAAVLFSSRPTPRAEAKIALKPPILDVIYARPQTYRARIYSQGTVRPKWDIEITAETSGRVDSVADNFIAGGFMHRGEELLQVEVIDYELALAEAQSDVAQATQQLAQERGQALLAQREWKELGNREANELFLRKPQIIAAEAQLNVARVRLKKAQQDLDRTRLLAPFNGRLISASIQHGEQVNRGDVVARAFATEVMEVPLPLTSREVGLVNLPMHADAEIDIPVEFSVEVGGKNYRWPGHIVRTEAGYDTQSRVVYAIAEVKGAYAKRADNAPPFTPGLFAQARITGRSFDEVIRLPRKALYERSNLLTLNVNNELEVVAVEVIQTEDDFALVGGVAEGTAILLERPKLVIKNMRIRPNDISRRVYGGGGQGVDSASPRGADS